MKLSANLTIYMGLAVLAALLLYLPGLDGPLFFDDKPALSANELVQISGNSFDEWRSAAFSSNSGPLKRPVAMLSFAANHALTGSFSSFSLKAVNLVIHLVIALLLYFLFRCLLDSLAIGRDDSTRSMIAITAAAIWLLHPLQVSTVLYAVQRMAQLAALFIVLGLWVFTHYRCRWAQQGAPPGEVIAAGLWLVSLTMMAALSKENGALLPWLIIVLEVSVFRGQWAGISRPGLQLSAWLLLVLPVCLVVLVWVYQPGLLTAGYIGREFSLEERLLTQARLLWRYLGWIILPNINDMGFQHDDIPLSTGLFQPLTTCIAIAAWLLALALAFFLRRRLPLLLTGLLFFLVGHSMESSILPLEMVYEHRNYLPGMLVCLALAALLVISATRLQRVNVWYPALGVLVLWSVLLLIRVQIWSDEVTLFRVEVDNHPESSRSNYFYANALLRRYRYREELGHNAQESRELLLARHYFERMYQANNRDVAALVMLYYLDSRNFRQLQQQVDWLARLESLLETRVLQPSDWNALDTLFECFASGPCELSRARVFALLDTLADRYPDHVQVTGYRYKYLAATGAGPAQLLPLLQQAQESSPGSSWVYPYLLSEYVKSQDVAGAYETAQLWLANDPGRFKLPVLQLIFVDSAGRPGLSND